MQVKISEASGVVLDWLVAKCEDVGNRRLQADEFPLLQREGRYLYSSDWAQGGPIIAREGIATSPDTGLDWWVATMRGGVHVEHGPTPLIAALRCYVASKLGEEVEVPDELRKPCRSPYCECEVGKCKYPDHYDARGTYPEGYFATQAKGTALDK